MKKTVLLFMVLVLLGTMGAVELASAQIRPTPTQPTLPSGTILAYPAKGVFVTSSTYDGNLGGVAGADAKCQEAARSGGLTGTYKAWIASSSSNPAITFKKSPGPYILRTGEVVAKNWNALISSGTYYIQHSINRDEHFRFVGIDCTNLTAWDCAAKQSQRPTAWTGIGYDRATQKVLFNPPPRIQSQICVML